MSGGVICMHGELANGVNLPLYKPLVNIVSETEQFFTNGINIIREIVPTCPAAATTLGKTSENIAPDNSKNEGDDAIYTSFKVLAHVGEHAAATTHGQGFDSLRATLLTSSLRSVARSCFSQILGTVIRVLKKVMGDWWPG